MGKRILYRDIQKTVNIPLLYQELAAALGSVLVGVKAVEDGTRIALLDPSPENITTATQIVQAHDASQLTAAQQALETIKELIQEAVGKTVTDLTTAERWALLAGLLYQNKAIAPDMTIRPPRYWIAEQDVTDD